MTPGARRRPAAAALVLVLAVLALAATVAARPPHAPPLYDGLGFPDEAYRWVVAPAGSPGTASATAATVTVRVSGGTTAAAQALSAEQGPQVAVAVDGGTFSAAGAPEMTLSAQPRAVPPTPPDGGEVVSNLYDLTATAAGRPVPLAPGHTVLVNLRAASATDQAVVICRWTGRRWEQVPTEQVGTEIYAARLTALGPVAVVRLDRGVKPTVSSLVKASAGGPGAGQVAGAVGAAGAGAGAPPGGGPGVLALLLVLGGVVVVLAAGVLLVRRRSGSAGAESDDPPAEDAHPA